MTRATCALLLLLAGAAGCRTTSTPLPEPVVRTVEVQVPVDDPACARAATEALGAKPAYPDSDEALRAAMDIFEQVQLLLAGRRIRIAETSGLRGALAACK